MPKGLTIFSRLNAAQFSSFFKGTSVARLAPATRGKVNKAMNAGSDMINGFFENEGVPFLIINQLGKEPTEN